MLLSPFLYLTESISEMAPSESSLWLSFPRPQMCGHQSEPAHNRPPARGPGRILNPRTKAVLVNRGLKFNHPVSPTMVLLSACGTQLRPGHEAHCTTLKESRRPSKSLVFNSTDTDGTVLCARLTPGIHLHIKSCNKSISTTFKILTLHIKTSKQTTTTTKT